MKNLFGKLETLLMASTYLEANARKYAEECIRDGFENVNETQKRKGLRKQKQQKKRNQQRLLM